MFDRKPREGESPMKKKALFAALVINLILLAVFLTTSLLPERPQDVTIRSVNYNEFMQMAESRSLSEADINREEVIAETQTGERIRLTHNGWLYTGDFPKELAASGVTVNFPNEEIGAFKIFGMVVSVAFPMLMLLIIGGIGIYYLRNIRLNHAKTFKASESKNVISFDDVAGHRDTKIELTEIRTFLKDPGAYERVGAKPPRGVLLVGPPGTGKTLLARALAHESGARFISTSGSSFTHMWAGLGRKHIIDLFKEARKKTPTIIFIDEIDSLARARGGGSDSVTIDHEATLNQLLVEMDGFEPDDGVIVVAATNRPETLDPAVLRPGRFDRHVHVGLPDIGEREDILKVHARKIVLDENADLISIARGTPGFSGADLANIINEAAIFAAREGAQTVTRRHLGEARDKVIAGVQRKSMVLSEEERELIAYHEAGHALVACLSEHSDPVHQATIIPRGQSLGYVIRLPERDRVSVRKSKLLADLDVLAGGRAAEEIVFGENAITTGASADIREATSIARRMVSEWGMSDEIGMMLLPSEKNGSLPEDAKKAVKGILEKAYANALKIIQANEAALHAVASALKEAETVEGDAIRKIVNEHKSMAK